MSNISLITKLGLIVTTVGTLTVGVRYTSNFDNIEEAINELANRGKAYYTMATTSKEDLAELQSKYDTLNATHKAILAKLQLEEGATVEQITSKIDSLVSEGNTDTLSAIGALIGLKAPVTADNVTQALNNMNEQLTTLETEVSTLEAELEQAKLDLQQANSEQDQITALLESCMAQVPAIEEEPGEEPGGTVEPTTTYCNTHTEIELVDGICNTCANLETLEATMNEAWDKVVAELPSSAKNETDYNHIKAGNYKIDGMNYLYVSNTNKGSVDKNLDSLITAYLTAKTDYLNAGGII